VGTEEGDRREENDVAIGSGSAPGCREWLGFQERGSGRANVGGAESKGSTLDTVER
jgi:hypothetical protein